MKRKKAKVTKYKGENNGLFNILIIHSPVFGAKKHSASFELTNYRKTFQVTSKLDNAILYEHPVESEMLKFINNTELR